MGLFLGTISNFNPNKGLITLEINEPLEIGDTISIESEKGAYTVSEITHHKDGKYRTAHMDMCHGNAKSLAKLDLKSEAKPIVTIGRMKGDIKKGLKVFKMSSKKLTTLAESSFINAENKKIPLKCKLEIHLNKPVKASISTLVGDDSFYTDINFDISSDIIPEPAIKAPISEERIKSQISKTGNTPYEFKEISINMDSDLYIPHIADINNLRRNCLEKIENVITQKYCKKHITLNSLNESFTEKSDSSKIANAKISILLNKLNLNENYSLLKNVNRIYIPLKYFFNTNYSSLLTELCEKFEIYIYLPLIMRDNYKKLLYLNLENILSSYNVKGFIISNIGNLEMLKKLNGEYSFIGNYSLNIFNNFTAMELNNLGINTVTLSPELNENDYTNFSYSVNSELIIYGNIPIMNINYCPLSKNNKCFKDCKRYCIKNTNYYLIDRLGFKFEIIPDSIDCITTIYNSKTLSIMPPETGSSFRLDFIHESVKEINSIVESVKNRKKIEGQNFTNGNWFREI